MNKTVLVTGSAVRIGRQICLSMAEAGWDVIIHYRNSFALAQELALKIASMKRTVHMVQADLEDESSTADIFHILADKKVHVDCLINNASLFEKNNFMELTRENMQRHMAVNCFAPMQLARDFAAQYKGQDGNIINITDGLEGWSMSPVFFSYAISKHALRDATVLLTRTLAPRIRINAIAPGPVLEGTQDNAGTFSKLRNVIPVNRTGKPEEICETIQFILRSPSLTGQSLLLSGGLHTHPQWAV